MRSAHGLTRSLPAIFALLLMASTARAQGTGRSLDVDVSIRAAGMGQASNAVFWGGELNQWSNPAVLGYARGLRYEYGNTQLVPDLSSSVFFRSNVLKLAGGGLGVFFAGKPAGLGSVNLEYGESQAVDENGNPIGTFEAYEHIDSWGFGLSLAQAIETVARHMDHEPPMISRMADISVGMNSKTIDMFFAPSFQGGATTLDRGLLVRLSPLEILPASRDLPLALDLAYGWSELSYDDATVNFPTESAPLSHHHRKGYAGRIALEIPSELRRRWEDHRGGWLVAGLEPLLSFGYAKDHDHITPPAEDFVTDGSGIEITVANIYSYRQGHYEDPLGHILGDTEGWSVGLPLGRLAGVRYDYGKIPEAAPLSDVTREGWSAWVDPIGLWSVWKSR